jgi:hypothetical protein
MNVLIINPPVIPPRDDEGPDFERLLRQLDNDDPDFHGVVEFGRNGQGYLSDRGGQRLGQSLLRATAHRRQFRFIKICTDDMTANADQYSALLEFFATGPNRNVVLVLSKGSTHANQHILTAMNANPQPGNLVIREVAMTMQTLRLALQGPRHLSLVACRMSETESPPVPPPAQQVLSNDTTTNRDDYPEASAAALVVRNNPARGSSLRLVYDNIDCIGILKAATKLHTNVTSLHLDFNAPLAFGRFGHSSLISFAKAQPNGMEMRLSFSESSRFDREINILCIYILMNKFSTTCPDVHSLFIHASDGRTPLLNEKPNYISLFMEAVSKTALTRFEFSRTFYTTHGVTVLSLEREEEQQIAAITQRNSLIPVYLGTTKFLKPRRPPPAVDNPVDSSSSIVVYANDGVDRNKHQYVLSHALSQAAVHPFFFLHLYEYVRDHVGELFVETGGQPGQMRGPTEDAFFVASNDDDDEKQGAL